MENRLSVVSIAAAFFRNFIARNMGFSSDRGYGIISNSSINVSVNININVNIHIFGLYPWFLTEVQKPLGFPK